MNDDHKHMMRLQGRTDQGWQYEFKCDSCSYSRYPDVTSFGAVFEGPEFNRFLKGNFKYV